MADNYLMLDGKRVDLTDEQIEKLGLKKKSRTPFEIENGETYYFIYCNGEVKDYESSKDSTDEKLVAVANACRDKKLMEQRAMRETLDRLLWRFSCENGELERPWDGNTAHAIIFKRDVGFGVDWSVEYKFGCVSFPSAEIAKQAINRIVIPFCTTHPDFEW